MPLTETDFTKAAERLGVDVAAVKAVAEVESGPYGAFLPTGEPVILYERHIFRRLTKGRFDKSHPDLSNPKAGGYGKVSDQHAKLQRAVILDREAALQSCSWGLFQVLGLNWQSLGYENLQAFINAMYKDEAAHLDSFLRYVEVNNLARHLRTKNWSAFAKIYNGPAYKVYQYDVKLAKAYRKHSSAK